MNIHHNIIYRNTTSFLKERVLPFLKVHQRQIQIVVAVVFALLAAYCLTKRYCFKAKKPETPSNDKVPTLKSVSPPDAKEDKNGLEIQEPTDHPEDRSVQQQEKGEDGSKDHLLQESSESTLPSIDSQNSVIQPEIESLDDLEESETASQTAHEVQADLEGENESIENEIDAESLLETSDSSESDLAGDEILEDDEFHSEGEETNDVTSDSDVDKRSDSEISKEVESDIPDAENQQQTIAEHSSESDQSSSDSNESEEEIALAMTDSNHAESATEESKKIAKPHNIERKNVGEIKKVSLGSLKQYKNRYMVSMVNLRFGGVLPQKIQNEGQKLLDSTTNFRTMKTKALVQSSKDFIKFLNTHGSQCADSQVFERAIEISYVLQRKEETRLKDNGKRLIDAIQRIRSERGGRVHLTPKATAEARNLKREKIHNFIIAIADSALISDYKIISEVHCGAHVHFFKIYPQHQEALTQLCQEVKKGGTIEAAQETLSKMTDVSEEDARLIISSLEWYRRQLEPKIQDIKQILNGLISNDCLSEASSAETLFALMGKKKDFDAATFAKTNLGKYVEKQLTVIQKGCFLNRFQNLHQIILFHHRFGENLNKVMNQLSRKVNDWKLGNNIDRLVLTPDEYYVLNYIRENQLVKLLNLFTKHDSKSENFLESILGAFTDGIDHDKLNKIREFSSAFQTIVEGKFADELVKHRFSVIEEGDILFHHAERKDQVRGEELSSDHKVQIKVTGSKASHVSFAGPMIGGKRHVVDSYDDSIGLSLPDAEQTWTTTAYRFNAYELLTKKGKEVVGANANSAELVQAIYREAIAEVAVNKDFKYWREGAKNDSWRRFLSIPRISKTITKQSYQDIANEKPEKIICSEHTMRSQVQAMLLMEEKIREKYSIKTDEQLVEEIIPGNTNMANWHPGRMERLVNKMVKKGWMTAVKPIEGFPPSPNKL